MTQHLLDTYKVDVLNAAFENGYGAALSRDNQYISAAYDTAIDVRRAYGLSDAKPTLMTRPDANLKLAKSKVPSYGLTLYHYVFKSRLGNKITLNLCPNAGDCIKVCVIENGHGSRPSTQLAWRWRSDLLAHHAPEFSRLLGWELGKAAIKHKSLLLRPNVNSDIQWEKIIPAMTDGSVTKKSVKYYGYSKIPEYIDGNGDVTPFYRISYSYNENSPSWEQLDKFIERGGSVAVVTNRKPKSKIKQWSHHKVVDVDLTDEWMFKRGVVGDVSAKGRAAALAGKSRFVSEVY